MLDPKAMSPEQLAVHESVVAGPRGRMVGPLLAALHSPELAPIWSAFGEFLRFRTSLTKSINELAILVCGRHWTSQVEWLVHAQAAADAGVPPSVIDAIQNCQPPVFETEAELDVYEFTRLLLQTGQVPETLHNAIKTRWNVKGVVELAAVVGYYSLVAITLNAHEIPVPDGAPEPLPRTQTLVQLPPGRRAG
jgi:4-carboxymuconolactone decarboxylase